MQVAQKYQKELPRIKANVEAADSYFKPNVKRYHEFRKFVFDTAITGDDEEVLRALGKPAIECNTLEAYISRLRGEFSKQEPTITVRPAYGAPVNPQVIDIVQGYIRAILFDANNENFEYDIYTDILSGGFSVIKLWTEHENEMSFDQIIRIGRPYNITLTGFDPLAQKHHKGDGRFCYELFPKTVKEVEDDYPGVDLSDLTFIRKDGDQFNWSYTNKDDKILYVCDYYEKKKKKVKIYKLANNKVVTQSQYEQLLANWTSIEQPPAIVQQRKTDIEYICRYRIVGNQVLEYIETDFKSLPLIFVDGNSVTLSDSDSKSQQMTRPYVFHAKGVQRLKNFALQSLANELENMVQHKWIVADEAIPPIYKDAYIDQQIPNILVYNAFKKDTTTPGEIPLPAPQAVVRPPIPPEIMNTFEMVDQTMQVVLGSYDASLGINNNQLSGVALVEGATQSNAAAMPFVVGFLRGLNHAAQGIVDLIPKYLKTPRTIPIITAGGKHDFIPVNTPGSVKLDYEDNVLQVRVEPSVNFAVQKSRALQQIVALMQASPLFAQFMNTEGLEILINNLEIYDVDQLKLMAQQFMQQMKQQQQNQPPNPDVMKQQLEQQKFAASQQQNAIDNQLKQAEIANTAQANQNDRLKIILDAQTDNQQNVVQQAKANAETYAHAVDLALKGHDQQHRHVKEAIELGHQISNSQQATQTSQNMET